MASHTCRVRCGLVGQTGTFASGIALRSLMKCSAFERFVLLLILFSINISSKVIMKFATAQIILFFIEKCHQKRPSLTNSLFTENQNSYAFLLCHLKIFCCAVWRFLVTLFRGNERYPLLVKSFFSSFIQISLGANKKGHPQRAAFLHLSKL